MAYIDEEGVDYLFGIDAVILGDRPIGDSKVERMGLGIGEFLVKALSVGEAGAQVVNAVLMGAVQLRELFGKNVNGQICELQGQGNHLVGFRVAAQTRGYSRQSSTWACSACIAYIFINPMQKHRDMLVQKLRREKLRQILNTRRQEHQQQVAEHQHQEFLKYYPCINEHNYPQYRHKLADLVASPNYIYQIVIFGGIVYEFVLDNPLDSPSIFILKHITQHEEVEVPQTKEFVSWLIRLAESNPLDSLIITANLLQHRRYHGPFKNHLLDANFIKYMVQKCTGSFELQTLLGETICSLLSSLPRLAYEKADQLCSILVNFVGITEVTWELSDCCSQIRARFSPDEQFASIFLHYFSDLIKNTQSSELVGFLDFIFYCLLSGIYELKFMQPIQSGLSCKASKHAQITSIKCIAQFVQQEAEMELEWPLLTSLWQLLLTTEEMQVKLEMLKLFNIIPIGCLRELTDNIDSQEILQTLIKCLQEDMLIPETLKVIMAVIEVCEPPQEVYLSLGLKEMMEGLADKTGEVGEIAQMILNLL